MTSVLVVGADARIGASYLRYASAHGVSCAATSRRASGRATEHWHLDLADEADAWPDLPQVETAFLCAGLTRLQACESDPALATRINVDGVARLAEALHDRGAFVVYLSTNHVFDGSRPDRLAGDRTCPVTEYGRTKAAGEARILRLARAAVLRLTKVVEPPLDILTRWRTELRAGQTVTALEDLYVAPVPMRQVVAAMDRIRERRAPGVYHFSGERDVSYAAIAERFADRLGVPRARVARQSAQNAGIPRAFAPRYTTLAPAGLAELAPPDPLADEFFEEPAGQMKLA